MWRAVAVRIVLGLALFASSHAWAGASAGRTRARVHFERGYELSQAGDYERAAREFERAFDASPRLAVLYNLGQAYAASGDPVRARDAFLRCVEAPDGELSLLLRNKARDALRVAEGRIGRLRLVRGTPGVRVFLDGELLAKPFDAPVELKSGPHVIVGNAPGYEPRSTSVEVLAGREVATEVRLVPLVRSGHLAVECDVPEVELRINDAVEIMGPSTTVFARKPGAHRVAFRRAGYLAEEHSVVIQGDDLTRVECRGEFDPNAEPASVGRLTLRLPSDATASRTSVLVDGRAPTHRVDAATEIQLLLPRGKHAINVHANGREPVRVEVAVAAASTTHADIAMPWTFERISASREARRVQTTWSVLVGGAGATLTISGVVLYVAARQRHADWATRRDGLEGVPLSTPGLGARLRDHQRRALSIQRLQDAAFAAGAAGAVTLGIAAVLGFSQPRVRVADLRVSADSIFVEYSGEL